MCAYSVYIYISLLFYFITVDIKGHVVKKVYKRCDEVSGIYITRHPEDWLLGGENTILIVDEFPGGYMTETQPDINSAKKRNNNSHTIICIAEANNIPPRIWLYMIQTTPEVRFQIDSYLSKIKILYKSYLI